MDERYPPDCIQNMHSFLRDSITSEHSLLLLLGYELCMLLSLPVWLYLLKIAEAATRFEFDLEEPLRLSTFFIVISAPISHQ